MYAYRKMKARRRHERLPIHHCSTCQRWFRAHEVIRATEGKAAGLMGGLIAGAATKNLWATLGIAFLGVLAGHLVDQEVSPRCPLCGAVLHALIDATIRP